MVRETTGPHLMCREACALSLGPIQTQPRWVCIRGGRVCGFFKGQRHAVSSKLKDTVPGRYSHRGLVLNRRPFLRRWGTISLLSRSFSGTASVGVHTGLMRKYHSLGLYRSAVPSGYIRLCLGPYGGPREGAVSYGRGTPGRGGRVRGIKGLSLRKKRRLISSKNKDARCCNVKQLQ